MARIKNLKNENEVTYPITVEKAIYDDNGNRLDNKISQLTTDVNSKCNANLISDAYSPSKTYYNGDLVIYNNELWKYDKVGASGTSAIPSTSIASRTSLGDEIKPATGTVSLTASQVTQINDAVVKKVNGIGILQLDIRISINSGTNTTIGTSTIKPLVNARTMIYISSVWVEITLRTTGEIVLYAYNNISTAGIMVTLTFLV